MTLAATVNLTVSAVAVAMDGSDAADLDRQTVTVGPDAAVLALTVPTGALREGEMLAYVWAEGESAAGRRPSLRRSPTRPMTFCRRS